MTALIERQRRERGAGQEKTDADEGDRPHKLAGVFLRDKGRPPDKRRQHKQQVGLATTTATNGGFLTALYVVLVPVFVFAQTGVRPRQVVLVAGLGSVAGAWLLTDSGQLQSWTSGDALVLIADIAWAAGISLVPTFLARTNRPYFLAFAQFGVIGVLGAVVGLGGEPFSLEGLSAALPSILYAGLCSGGIAFTLQIVALNYTPAAEAALIMSLESVFAALSGSILLSERLTTPAMLGGLLIVLSAVLVEAGPAAQNIWASQYWVRLSQVWSRAR